jgi:Matrixin
MRTTTWDSTRTVIAMLVAAVGVGTLCSKNSSAYVANGPTWGTAPVSYYVNPNNMDLPASSVEAAVRAGADTWYVQSGTGPRFSLAGQSSQTTNTYDGINLVMFRNASSGLAIATTYWWSNDSRIVDADIVFWDGAFQFFAGSTGCSGGFYIEDIAAHEFGHALGLGHSASTAATMYYATSACNTSNRSLDADDIAGVQALYPLQAQPPQAPTGLRFVR